jgi:hypothetical protein
MRCWIRQGEQGHDGRQMLLQVWRLSLRRRIGPAHPSSYRQAWICFVSCILNLSWYWYVACSHSCQKARKVRLRAILLPKAWRSRGLRASDSMQDN